MLTTEQIIGIVTQVLFWIAFLFTPSKEKHQVGSVIGLIIQAVLIGAVIMHAIMTSI